MREVITYKVKLQQESKILSVPTSMQVFGYLFSKIICEKKLNGRAINKYLDEINDKPFNISSLMPAGYVVNPTVNYFLNDVSEEYTEEKSKLSKRVKRKEYINKEYLEDNLWISDDKLYLNIQNIDIDKDLINYSPLVAQHVQINTSEDKKPNPFNNICLNVKNQCFEFYISIDKYFEQTINKIFSELEKTNGSELIILGGQSSKGYNMFSFKSKEQISDFQATNSYLNLGYYFPKTKVEIVSGLGTEVKLKNMALRPVRKLASASNETRYRTFVIKPGNIMELATANYGCLVDYKQTNDDYKPKIYLKSFMFPLVLQTKGGKNA